MTNDRCLSSSAFGEYQICRDLYKQQYSDTYLRQWMQTLILRKKMTKLYGALSDLV